MSRPYKKYVGDSATAWRVGPIVLGDSTTKGGSLSSDYDAYGSSTVLDADGSVHADGLSDVKNPYLFTARRLDTESGLMQYRFRDSNPALGRFAQRDPIGYWGGSNLYEYVGGDPVGWVDPLALTGLPVPPPGFWTEMGPLPQWRADAETGATPQPVRRRTIAFVWRGTIEQPGKLAAGIEGEGSYMIVENVGHMLSALASTVGKCECIEKLTIISHGGYPGGGFRMTSNPRHGQRYEPKEVITMEKAGQFAKKIKPYMCSGSCTINIMACSSAGIALQEIARETGCVVRGAASYVSWSVWDEQRYVWSDWETVSEWQTADIREYLPTGWSGKDVRDMYQGRKISRANHRRLW